MPQRPAQDNSTAFLTIVAASVSKIQTETAGLFTALKVKGKSATDAANQLKISVNLAWKLSRLIESPTPLEGVVFLPGAEAFELLLKAASQLGADSRRMEKLRDAVREFDRLVAEHAGDRETLEILVSEAAQPTNSKAALAHRKAAFTANSAILGVQTRIAYRLALYTPTADGIGVQMASIRSNIDVRVLRSNARWAANGVGVRSSSGQPKDVRRRKPLDPQVPEGQPPFIHRFCSNIPEFERHDSSSNFVPDHVTFRDVGNLGKITCTFGDIHGGVLSRYRTPGDELHSWALTVSTPCTKGIVEAYVHESLFGDEAPAMEVHSRLVAGDFPLGRPTSTLPIFAPVERLGRGLAASTPLDVPDAADMVAFAFEQTDWNPTEFLKFRTQIDYPPIASDVVLYWRMPDPPHDVPPERFSSIKNK